MKLLLILSLFFSVFGTAKEIKYKSPNGLILNANLIKVADWQQPTLLIVHGTLSHRNSEIIQGLQDRLAEHRINSLAINLSLGLNDRQGPYDCSIPHHHLHQEAIDEIGLWVDWLKKQGAQSIVLLGHSRGGNQAAWFAVQRGGVDRLILIAPQTWRFEQVAQKYQRKYHHSLQNQLNRARFLSQNHQSHVIMHGTDFLYCPQSPVSPASFLSYYEDPRQDTPYWLNQINIPVLILIGTEDSIVPDLSSRIPENRSIQVETIEGADHFFRDLYLDDLVDIAVSWLK